MPLSLFLNGMFVAPEDAKVFALDIGLTRGLGVYEGITAIGASVFKLKEHLDRLRKSANALGTEVLYSDEEIHDAIQTLIENTDYKRSEIRIYATGGPTIDSINLTRDNRLLLFQSIRTSLSLQNYFKMEQSSSPMSIFDSCRNSRQPIM